jgi:hypothetical protein
MEPRTRRGVRRWILRVTTDAEGRSINERITFHGF